MTKEEAIKLIEHIGIAFVPTDQYGDYDDPEPYEEAIDMAIEALQNEETLNTQLANCHKEILRLLDFNDITESPDDAIESQNDVIEVISSGERREK